MTHSLKEKLSHLGWNKARLMLLSQFILSLIKTRFEVKVLRSKTLTSKTVNLTEVALAFEGKAKVSSNYKRLQRFLRSFEIDFTVIAKLIACWLPKEVWILCLDRTNWKLGTVNINILVLAVAYKGIAIPLFWTLLNKRGNSNTQERKDLMERFLSTFPIDQIKYLTADREFKGKDWIKYLLKRKIPFRIRIPNNTKVFNRHRTKQIKIQRLFRLSMNELMVLNTPYRLWGCDVYIGCLRKKDDVIIISNERSNLIQDYARRWEIETLFGCLKTKGFNLEETHLTDQKRISKLFAVLTITFAWCYMVGTWLNDKKPIPIAKHKRRYLSLFRHGLDYIRHILLNFDLFKKDFIDILRFFNTKQLLT